MRQAFKCNSRTFYTHPQKNQITNLVVFGDSLSDTGNLSTLVYQVTGGQYWLPPSPPLPGVGPYSVQDPYYNSATLGETPKVRATDGPNWADSLSNNLGLTMSNFAYAGATTGTNNVLQPLLPSNFPPLPGLGNEINNFTNNLGSGKANPKTLYVIWAGGNDISNIANSPTSLIPGDLATMLPMITNVVKTAITNIATDITTLASKGARTFLVPNLPDLGATPAFSQSKNSAFIGTVFTLAFDIGLAAELPKLERSLKIDIVQPDVYSLFQEVINQPQEFGFTNVTDPLIGQNPNDPLVKPDEFLFYDTEHPTTGGHKVIANFFQDSLFQAGYINQGASGVLPQITGSLLDKEINLVGTLVNGISDVKPSDLIKYLFALIPDGIGSVPHFLGQYNENSVHHLT